MRFSCIFCVHLFYNPSCNPIVFTILLQSWWFNMRFCVLLLWFCVQYSTMVIGFLFSGNPSDVPRCTLSSQTRNTQSYSNTILVISWRTYSRKNRISFGGFLDFQNILSCLRFHDVIPPSLHSNPCGEWKRSCAHVPWRGLHSFHTGQWYSFARTVGKVLDPNRESLGTWREGALRACWWK